jgi:hypothetical protein
MIERATSQLQVSIIFAEEIALLEWKNSNLR